MVDFINGANVALSLVAGLVFVKFWTQMKDRLFLLFAIAMWVLALNRAAIVLLPYVTTNASEHNALIYSARLVAFVLILAAIIDKGRRGSSPLTMRASGS